MSVDIPNYLASDQVAQQNRLAQALALLGYEQAKELHYRSNLVHAIQLFAAVQNDTELELECDNEITRIRLEITSAQSSNRTSN